jgi:hypothetical protein
VPAHTVFLVVSNDELRAAEAWRMRVAESIPNVYIPEEGVNGWLDTLARSESGIQPAAASAEDVLRYDLAAAIGAANEAAYPDRHEFGLGYEPRFKLGLKRGPTGGCPG